MSGQSKIKALQQWLSKQVEGYPGVAINNFTTSFRDGLAFCALIHKFKPELIDFHSLKKENDLQNFELAFRIAEKDLGIPALLDPEDMVAMPVPDKLSVITYVSQYYNYLHSTPPAGGPHINMFNKNKTASLKRLSGNISNTDKNDRTTPTSPAKVPMREPNLSSSNVRSNPNMCHSCGKKVYILEKHQVDDKLFHRSCYRQSQIADLKTPRKSFHALPRDDKDGDHPDNHDCLLDSLGIKSQSKDNQPHLRDASASKSTHNIITTNPTINKPPNNTPSLNKELTNLNSNRRGPTEVSSSVPSLFQAGSNNNPATKQKDNFSVNNSTNEIANSPQISQSSDKISTARNKIVFRKESPPTNHSSSQSHIPVSTNRRDSLSKSSVNSSASSNTQAGQQKSPPSKGDATVKSSASSSIINFTPPKDSTHVSAVGSAHSGNKTGVSQDCAKIQLEGSNWLANKSLSKDLSKGLECDSGYLSSENKDSKMTSQTSLTHTELPTKNQSKRLIELYNNLSGTNSPGGTPPRSGKDQKEPNIDKPALTKYGTESTNSKCIQETHQLSRLIDDKKEPKSDGPSPNFGSKSTALPKSVPNTSHSMTDNSKSATNVKIETKSDVKAQIQTSSTKPIHETANQKKVVLPPPELKPLAVSLSDIKLSDDDSSSLNDASSDSSKMLNKLNLSDSSRAQTPSENKPNSTSSHVLPNWNIPVVFSPKRSHAKKISDKLYIENQLDAPSIQQDQVVEDEWPEIPLTYQTKKNSGTNFPSGTETHTVPTKNRYIKKKDQIPRSPLLQNCDTASSSPPHNSGDTEMPDCNNSHNFSCDTLDFCPVKRRIHADGNSSGSYDELLRELIDVNRQQTDVEVRGRFIQDSLWKADESSPHFEELMLAWLRIVEEKNALFQSENDLVIRMKQHQLEDQHSNLEYELRVLLSKPAGEWTEEDRVRESELTQRLVKTVDARANLIDIMHRDEQRRLAEESAKKDILDPKCTDILSNKHKNSKSKGRKKSTNYFKFQSKKRK